MNVDPATGSIVKGGQDQQRYLDDGTQVLDVSIIWTEDTIDNAVDDAKSNGQLLNLLLKVVPIVGLAGGALFIVAGLLMLRGRRGGQAGGDGHRHGLRLVPVRSESLAVEPAVEVDAVLLRGAPHLGERRSGRANRSGSMAASVAAYVRWRAAWASAASRASASTDRLTVTTTPVSAGLTTGV